MAERINGVAHQLRALLQQGSTLPDAELLSRFVAGRDGEAFADIVQRHGPMVLAVCRRVLGNAADADDAFQATFLVLARRAASVRPQSLLASWLYGVAYRTASEARRAAVVRRAKERRAAELRDRSVPPPDSQPDLRELLDRELASLPDVYRAAIVLCDLEGLPRREAAGRLGWTEGTLSGRLFRARTLLAGRLSNYGLTVTGAMLAAVSQEASAVVPVGLAAATTHAGVLVAAGQAAAVVASAQVAALTKGVMRAMLLTKLKGMTAGLMVACAVTATGVAGWGVGPADAQERPAAGGRASPRDPDKDRIAQLERERQELLKLVAELRAKLADLEAGRKSPEPKTEALLDLVRKLSVDPTSPPPGAADTFNPYSSPPAAKPGTPRPEVPPAGNLPPGARPRVAEGMAVVLYPVGGLARDEKQAEAVVRILKAAVSPASWEGGGAVAEYFPQRNALFVRQTADGHEQVRQVLHMLRDAVEPSRGTPSAHGSPRPGGSPPKM